MVTQVSRPQYIAEKSDSPIVGSHFFHAWIRSLKMFAVFFALSYRQWIDIIDGTA